MFAENPSSTFNLSARGLVAVYDHDTHLAHLFFQERLTRENYATAHDWLYELAAEIGVESLTGIVLDLRRVRVFDRLASLSLERIVDMSDVPHALVVHPYQEQLIALCFGEPAHKCMVSDNRAALCFIDDWNRIHQRGFEPIARRHYDDITEFKRYFWNTHMQARGF